MCSKLIKGNYRTNCKSLLGDLHTPVSIYLKVRDMYPQSVLMESSDFHVGENSLSFIALCPLASIGINGGVATMLYPDNSKEETSLDGVFTVEKALNQFIDRFSVCGDKAEVCGLYG
jgi:anthranilate synthase component 1